MLPEKPDPCHAHLPDCCLICPSIVPLLGYSGPVCRRMCVYVMLPAVTNMCAAACQSQPGPSSHSLMVLIRRCAELPTTCCATEQALSYPFPRPLLPVCRAKQVATCKP
jgi:hypothetical protein